MFSYAQFQWRVLVFLSLSTLAYFLCFATTLRFFHRSCILSLLASMPMFTFACRCSRCGRAYVTFLMRPPSCSFRGIELEALLDKSQKELLQLLTCRIRRRFARGIPRAYNTLLKKLRKAKKATAAYDKPATVKTHLRNMPIIPEMIGSVVGVYNGQFFVNVEVKVSRPDALHLICFCCIVPVLL